MARQQHVKHSVAVVIPPPSPADEVEFLAVKRPLDDPDLPGVWGLPAASLRAGESWEDAVRRVGEGKLGVALRDLEVLREGTLERSGYLLHMKLFAGRIVAGEPTLARGRHDVTLYTAWKWATPADLEQGAQRGSLCCRLYLQELGLRQDAEAG